MPEILTESFCERCGTRYTFESAAPRAARLKGLKVVSRGLKNFVLSDDSSLDEAMAAARSDTDREVTAQQLDAFHKTFNFCMSCRQYTCANCWNETEGRCLSCAPHLGHEILPAPFPDLGPAVIGQEANGNGNGAEDYGNGHAAAAAMLAWPTSDLLREDEVAPDDGEDIPEIDAVARLAVLDALVADEPVEAAPDDAVAEAVEAEATEAAAIEVADAPIVEAVAAEAIVAEPDEPAADAPVAAAEPEVESAAPSIAAAAIAADAVTPDIDTTAAAASAQTTDLLHRFRPGQSLDEAIEAFERDRLAAEDVAKAAALAAAASADDLAEKDDDTEPGSVAAAAAAAAALAASRQVDDIEQPTWQIVAPETPAAPDSGPAPTGPVAPVVPPQPVAPPVQGAEPQWPAAPEWPSHQAASAPLMNRAAASNLDTLWAESAREVATVAAVPGAAAAVKAGVQPCVSCGLSLSATARFCRRCGTRQG